ncbi:ankyrin repeat-containing protein [Encephalitozoon intestinalis ATCC 50506]|uniref:Ankyrin repeat-containing protein n=1 Tax=Encephalitozoon intestinalis (strain ATCC 50506) TaxID=876142 RepID=E0S6F8_ENCIT|nr:ankyrin repeat-containing protein [Encephalitozoon intestinalis ATCC 50506]ADM11293.1 ankyrin repeat-containing protein [Encephalitozoon intestinalis ATCC 50506]UTX44962.1 ankyrin repeat-containing protein [Encephalitozoon intestinalis]
MKLEKSAIMRKKRQGYSEFIVDDTNWNGQRTMLIKLHSIYQMYRSAGVIGDVPPDMPSKSLLKASRGTIAAGYKLHLVKMALIDERPFKFNFESRRYYFKNVNIVFLLGMIKNKPELVYSMLSNGFPNNINSSIFGSPMFPTYFHLACAMHHNILSVFLKFSPSYSLCWNGLTPQMIASFSGKSLESKQPFNFVSMKQYLLLNSFRGFKITETDEKPIFLIDFLCMENDMEEARRVLNRNPELSRVSKICYLAQDNIEWIMFLSRYQTSVHQEFNGISPLHISSINGNFEGLVALVALGSYINSRDRQGNTPMHYCAMMQHFRCLELLIRLGGNMNMVNREGISTEDILISQGKVFDIKEVDLELPEALFQTLGDSVEFRHHLSIIDRIKYNCNHTIVKKNRFTITSLLNLPHKIDYTEDLIQKVQGVKDTRRDSYSPRQSLQIFLKNIQ